MKARRFLVMLGITMVSVLGAAACGPTGTGGPLTSEPTESPSAASTLANTQWRLVSFGAPDEELPVVEGTSVTLEFGADNQAGGSGGCNSYGGAYQVQGDTLTFGEMTSTLRACADERVMQQEADYFEALRSTSTFDLTGDRLTISYDEGRGVLNFISNS